MNYDPTKYETVKERKKRFYADNPEGRIIVEYLSNEPLEYALFKATIYLDKSDIVKSTGYAMEVRDKELSVNKYGKEYESVNYSSWTENCEESSIGRALDNASYAGNDKCSREEMQKAERMNETMKKKNDPYIELAYNTVKEWLKTDKITTANIQDIIKKETGRDLLLKELPRNELDKVLNSLKKLVEEK